MSAHLLVPEAAHPDCAGVPNHDDHPDAVVLGYLGAGWTFERINHAFRRVRDGADLIALGQTRYWQAEGGLQLDVGPFVAALEYATGAEAQVFGKPEPSFFLTAVEALGLESEAIAFVGDDAETDVRAANGPA